MYGVKNLARRLKRHEIDFYQANAIFPQRAQGLEDFIAEARQPRKKRGKKVGGTRFKLQGGPDMGLQAIRDRKFGTQSILSGRYADKLRGSQKAIAIG